MMNRNMIQRNRLSQKKKREGGSVFFCISVSSGKFFLDTERERERERKRKRKKRERNENFGDDVMTQFQQDF